jgi:hypothetical protein
MRAEAPKDYTPVQRLSDAGASALPRGVKIALAGLWCLILAGLLALLWMGEAEAHEAASGEWLYPAGCCNSAATAVNGDCARIASFHVVAGQGGYDVTLFPGDHPQLKTKGYIGTVPYATTRDSPDGEFHICLATNGTQRYCFFAPPPGV